MTPLALAVALTAHATTLQPLDDAALARLATRIVEGDVRRTWTEADDNGLIWTRAEVVHPNGTLVVDIPGGRLGDRRTLVPGAPRMQAGDRARFFLTPIRGARWSPVGLTQGVQVLAPSLSRAAWAHAGAAWSPQDMPLAWEVTTTRETSLPEGFIKTAFSEAFTAWTDHDCLDLTVAAGADSSENSGNKVDGHNLVTVDDPFDQVTPGVWALSVLTTTSEVLFTQQGVDYERIVEVDILLNDNVTFATDADIDDGCSAGSVSIQSVAMREVGHFLGLSEACGRGAACTGAAEAATMHWLIDPCSTERTSLEEDDLFGLAALYGPYVPTSCSPAPVNGQIVGLAPFTVTCQVDDTTETTGATWDFGTGDPVSGTTASFTYDTPGLYDIDACITSPLTACAIFDACPSRPDFVAACETLTLDLGWDVIEGDATIQLTNATPEPAAGCLDTVQWMIYDSNVQLLDVIEDEWQPIYTFPGPGDYSATLEISGAAGVLSASTFPHVDGAVDTGNPTPPPRCNCATGPVGGWILPGLLPLVALRRRGPARAVGARGI